MNKRFWKESSKEEAEQTPEGDISTLLHLYPRYVSGIAGEHFNPADQRHSAAPNNQPEIRCTSAGRQIAAKRNKRTRY